MTTTMSPTRTTPTRSLRGPRKFVRDTRLVMTREIRPVLRDPFSVIFGMIQPLVFLALFGPLLVGSLGGQAESTVGESVMRPTVQGGRLVLRSLPPPDSRWCRRQRLRRPGRRPPPAPA